MLTRDFNLILPPTIKCLFLALTFTKRPVKFIFCFSMFQQWADNFFCQISTIQIFMKISVVWAVGKVWRQKQHLKMVITYRIIYRCFSRIQSKKKKTQRELDQQSSSLHKICPHFFNQFFIKNRYYSAAISTAIILTLI